MTRFEITTATKSAGSGICSITPLRKGTFVTPAPAGVALRESEHLIRHVKAVNGPAFTDLPRGQDHIDAATRAEIEDRLALPQLRDGDRVPAAKRRERRRLRSSQRCSASQVTYSPLASPFKRPPNRCSNPATAVV